MIAAKPRPVLALIDLKVLAQTATALVVVLQVLDLLTTVLGVSSGISEHNPVVAAVLASTGLLGFTVAKLAVAAVLAANLRLLPPVLALACAGASLLVTGAAVLGNLSLLGG
jgi:hypothetical protein